MNAQREVIYKRRRNALHGDRIRTDIANMFYELVEAHVLATHPVKDFDGFRMALLTDFGIEPPFDADAFAPGKPEDLAHQTYLRAEQLYQAKLADLAERAHPVIQRVHDDEKNDFKNILGAVQRRPQDLASGRGHRTKCAHRRQERARHP